MVMEFASRKPHNRQDRLAFRLSRSRVDMVDQIWKGAAVVAFIGIMAVGAGATFSGHIYPDGIQAVIGLMGAALGGFAGWAGFARG